MVGIDGIACRILAGVRWEDAWHLSGGAFAFVSLATGALYLLGTRSAWRELTRPKRPATSAAAAVALLLLLTPGAYAHEGWGIATHDRLGVVFSDIPGNAIQRVVGDRIEPLLTGVHSHELVIGADGAIYGTNPEPSGELSSVWRVDAAGHFSYVIPPRSDLPLGLQSFLVGRDGAIYSANRYDHRRPSVVLLRRDQSGKISALAGHSTGFADGTGAAARFSAIDGMRERPNGDLVVVDGAYLRSVTREGQVSTLTRPLTRRRWGEDLLGISSIEGGAVHVADHAERRILRVSLATGEEQEVYESALLWAPSGVEVSPGALYVLEHLRPPLSMLGDLQVGPYLRLRRVTLRTGSTATLGVVWGRYSAPTGAVLLVVAVLVTWLSVRIWRRRFRHEAA